MAEARADRADVSRPPSPLQFTALPTPQPGEVPELAAGLRWARLPLPFILNHVNVWFLDDGQGWTAVDAGIESPDMRALWEAMLAGPLSDRPLARLVATHGHTDHVGLAGHLVARHDIPFASTLIEWLWARIRHADSREPPKPHVAKYMARNGCDAALVKRFASDRSTFSTALGPPPRQIERLHDGATLRMGGRDWRIITAGGHSEEHASFYCEADHILIAGDQVLSHITPVIGVFPGEPDADPLAEYLASLDRFAGLPEDTLVLPSHGLPFHGLHLRLAALRDHHIKRLDRLREALDRPMSAYEAAVALFPRAMGDGHAYLAISETLAHLHRLRGDGLIVSALDAAGVQLFTRR
ncbi:MBL fold metallo-hydrolase [Phreatobacter stygius]|uniref:MBL fold metallo-hydrolase n=1 Tax=Phreatobacter stygius TaxID=1940610 RepID=A0A4D7B4N2_9HYPH|nr:MBL fold metallo-hydrolase [Phreatobacter stygius]QCI65020.1 MBL fold metallo-hydrolase [Phreatobacter stygius]